MRFIEGLMHRKPISPQLRRTVVDTERYLAIHELCNEIARKTTERRGHGNTQKTPSVEVTALALEEEYRRRQRSQDTAETNSRQWPGGHEGDRARQTIHLLESEIRSREQAYQPEKVTRLKIVETIFRTARALPEMTTDQQEYALSLGGRTRKAVAQDVSKIALSATIAGVLTPIVTGIIGVGSVALEACAPFQYILSNVPIPLLVGLSYVAQYATLIADAYQNTRLMKDDRYRATPSVFATGLGHATKAIFPDKQIYQDIIAGVGTLIPALFQESAFLPLLATPLATVVIARNIAATVGVNLPLVGVSEFLLRAKNIHKIFDHKIFDRFKKNKETPTKLP